jgi:hypothetical protein
MANRFVHVNVLSLLLACFVMGGVKAMNVPFDGSQVRASCRYVVCSYAFVTVHSFSSTAFGTGW